MNQDAFSAGENQPGETGTWLGHWLSVALVLPGMLSLVIHLSALLAIAWWMLPGPEQPAAAEIVRHAEIVLARATADDQTNYLDEAESSSASEASTSAATEAALATATPALPDDSSESLPNLVELPSREGVGLPSNDFLAGADSTAALSRQLPSGVNEAAILAEDARRRGISETPVGTPGGLTLFSAAARGRSFALVIDRSASMGDQGLGAIRAAANELTERLKTLDDRQRVQVLAYHAGVTQMQAAWLPATDPNKQKLVDFLRGLPAFGSTNHTSALLAGLKLRPEVLFLLTDGDDPGMDRSQLRIVREQARGRTTIHAIHFGRGPNQAGADHFMRKLAADNGGHYVYVDLQ
jgi:hypothetical protein